MTPQDIKEIVEYGNEYSVHNPFSKQTHTYWYNTLQEAKLKHTEFDSRGLVATYKKTICAETGDVKSIELIEVE